MDPSFERLGRPANTRAHTSIWGIEPAVCCQAQLVSKRRTLFYIIKKAFFYQKETRFPPLVFQGKRGFFCSATEGKNGDGSSPDCRP